MCKTLFIIILFLAVPTGATAWTAAAQDRPADDGRLAVFLDCSQCDDAHIRREITFVDYVRDRESSDVHLLVTVEGTGGGGRAYTFYAIGRGQFEGQRHEATFAAPVTATEDDERSGVVRTLKVALVPFLMQTSAAERVSVHVEPAENREGELQEDPWKGWTIELYGDGFGDMESSQYSFHVRYGVFIDRVTETWKIRLRPYFNFNVDKFEQDDETIRSESRRDGFDSYVIRSISDHWSIGLFADVYSSTFANVDLRIRGWPGVEYSVFPYQEASRRQLTFSYGAGLGHVTYRDTTIFEKLVEFLPQHAFEAEYELTQPWGSLDFGIEFSQYLHDLDKYRFELDGGLSIRLTQGLSLRFWGELDLVHDQLNLRKDDASLEELLLRRRQLATNYELSGSVGFRYRFGSIYNNVVNTRF